MDIVAAVAADLAALADVTGDGGAALHASLDGLGRDARMAVPAYLGLTITVAHPDGPLTLSVLEPAAAGSGVLASLHLLLSPLYGALEGSTLTLYSGRPGAFDTLAGDLERLAGMDGATIVRDAHLHPPSHVPRASLPDRSAVNQSLGILIDRGMDAATARDELDALARRDDVDLATAARSLLDSTVPPESTQSS